MKNSKISWTDHTFNPWIGCASVSPGCKFCYAEVFAGQYLKVEWGNKPRHITADSTWKKPEQWQRAAMKLNTRKKVFCASLSDVFEDNAQLVEPRSRLLNLIERTPNLDWLLLTKRPHNILDMILGRWVDNFPKNIWLGATICNQIEYETNFPILKLLQQKLGVHVTFISFEPLLGPINPHLGLADWNIIGGESGFLKDARAMELAWVKILVDESKYLGKKTFFKQFGTQLAKKLKLKDTKGEMFEPTDLHERLQWLNIREFPQGYQSLFAQLQNGKSNEPTERDLVLAKRQIIEQPKLDL